MADKRFVAKNGLDNNNQTITNVSDPQNAQDAATKAFASNASNLTSGTVNAARLPAAPDFGTVTADALQFDAANPAATTAVGQMTWNPDDGTLDLGLKGGNVTLQLGQQEFVRVVNASGSTLTKGQVVYIAGAQGNRVRVALARSDSELTSLDTLGIVAESIASEAEGFVITAGLLRNIDTSAWAEGAVLWLSNTTAGALTTTRPVAPNHGVQLGFVVRAHASVGIVFVQVQNGYELDELHNVLIASPSTGDLLRYDGTKWINEAPTSANTGSKVVVRDASGNFAAGTITATLVGNASTATALATGRTISVTGDVTGTSSAFDGTANVSFATTLANSGVSAGTYNDSTTQVRPFTVDAKGRITAIGAAVTITPAFSSLTSKPTTLSGYGITDAQPLDADLTAIAALAGTSGFLKKTAADTWSLDTSTYLTGNQSITLSGDASGSGATAITVTLANSGVTAGTYGSSTAVPVVTVDAKGRVTSVTTSSISGSLTFTGDVTGTGSTGTSTALTLANSGVVAGTYTKVTVDAKGRVTTGASLASGDLPTYTGTISSSQVTTGLGFTPENAANKGVANGYASLDSGGKVPSAQLPSYVDDVLEYANTAGFPGTGETGKIYVALDVNKVYRWSGSAYVEISPSPGSTDAVTEGSTNLYFTNTRARNAISVSGSLGYNAGTGVISYTQPTNVSTFSNDSGYITSSALSPYLTTSTASSTYLPLSGGTLTNTLTISAPNTRDSRFVKIYRGSTGADQAGVTFGNAPSTDNWFIGHPYRSGGVFNALIVSESSTINDGNGTLVKIPLMYFTPGSGTAAGNVGIATDNPGVRLDVDGTVRSTGLIVNGSTYYTFSKPSPNAYQTVALFGNTDGGVFITSNNAIITKGAYYNGSWVATSTFGSGIDLQAADAKLFYFSGATIGQTPTMSTSHNILHAGNYNSYSPTLTGTGASGTWGINITGSASKYGGFIGDAYNDRNLRIYGGTNGDMGILGVAANGGFRFQLYGDSGANYGFLNGAWAGWDLQKTTNGQLYLTVSDTVYTALHSGNYSSYALPLSGGTLTGALTTQHITLAASGNYVLNTTNYSNQAVITGNWNGAGYWAIGSSGTHTIRIDQVSSALSTAFQSVSDIELDLGTRRVLHSGNYSSYSPTLTGGGASGTNWAISITGNAATVGGLSTSQLFNNMGANHGTPTDFNSVPGYGSFFVQGTTNGPDTGAGQFYGFSLGLGNDYTYGSYALQLAIPRYGYNGSSDRYVSIRNREAGTWGAWSKIWAGYADSAGAVAWTNVSGRPTAVSSFTNDSGYITGSYLDNYTRGAYNVIADYAGNSTWYIRSNGRFVWGRAHDWTQSFELQLGGGTAGANDGWAVFGQVQSNVANGTWRGIRVSQYASSANIDGDVRARRFYLGDDTNYVTGGNAGAIRSQTAYGFIDVGSMNSSWAHIQTDRARFYFGTSVTVDGDLRRYSDNALYIHSSNYTSYAPSIGGGSTIGGITYFSNVESLNLYGIRGRFSGEYIHLYNKVGIGHPSGWGEGNGSTPDKGLSTYGGTVIAYGNGAESLYYGSIRMVSGAVGSNAWSAATGNGVGRVFAPAGAAASWDGGNTGAIQIKLPFRAANQMWHMTVKIYNYDSRAISEYKIGNYSYDDGEYNVAVTCHNDSNAPIHNVRLGNRDGVDCVWIGETGTYWSYPVIAVTDFFAGFRSGEAQTVGTGWRIDIVQSFGNVGGSHYPASNTGNQYAYAYYGNSNVSGTGSASYHPSGIYSTGTNWLYGTMYLNNNNISGVGSISASTVSGSDVYTTGGWFRNHTNNNGIYWSNTGWHLYPYDSADFYMRSGSNEVTLRMIRSDATVMGYLHYASDYACGFLTASRAWRFRVDNNRNVNQINDLTADGAVYASNWFRTYGNSGWYSQTYGGGMFMEDGTWVRTYGSKSLYVGGGSIATTGDVTAYYSDERLKTKTGSIDNALDKVKQLSGFLYVENDLAKSLGYSNDKQQVGVSAQQVQAVLPEAVTLAPVDMHTDKETGEITSKSGENYLTVKYERLVPLLIEAIKEQQARIESLEARLNALS